MMLRRSTGAVLGVALSGAAILGGVGFSGAAGLPPPKFGQTVDIGLVKGVVVVRPRHGATFRLGSVDHSIPVGSTIDTTRGEVDLRTAYAPAGHHAGVQDGQFAGGAFTVRQRRGDQGLSELDLGLPSRAGSLCPSSGQAAVSRLSARTLALLRSTAHGKFRTRGRYSAATVRGTRWTTADRCDGTLVRVERGVVSVRDFVRHVTVTVRAGGSYLARAP
jgi:hypothetical protein